MKRPFLLMGLSILLALIFAVYVGPNFSVILSAIFLFISFLSIIIKKIRKQKVLPIAFLSVTLAFGLYAGYYFINVTPSLNLDGKDVVISGVVCELPYKSYNRYYYILQTDKVEVAGAKQENKIRLSTSIPLNLDLYDRITGKVHLFVPTGADSSFSSKSYYASKGIYLLSYLYEYEDYSTETIESKPLYYYFLKLRENLIESTRMLLPQKQSAVASGVLLGAKDLINQEIKENFKDSGVSHIISVSGLHMSLIANLFLALFLFLKFSKRIASLLSCGAVLSFMALTGFAPSVMRSGIMFLIFLLGQAFLKQADSMNSLGISILILTFINPLSAGDIGFLLSVFSTLGILLFAGEFNLFLKEKIENLKYGSSILTKICEPVSVTLCATLFSMPIVMLSFGQVSLISVVTNILVVFPCMVMMVVTLIFSILFLTGIFSFLAYPLALISGILINYMLYCTEFLTKLPFATVPTDAGFIKFWLGCVFILIFISILFYKNSQTLRISGILSMIILFLGIISYQVYQRNLTQLAVLDVGDGCCAVLTKNNKAAILSCSGSAIKSSQINKYLSSKNIKDIDYVFINNTDSNTSSFAQEIFEKYEPSYILAAQSLEIDEKLNRAIADSNKICYFENAAEIKFWGDSNLKIQQENENEYLFLTINSTKILILPNKAQVDSLTQEFKNCDIFIFNKLPRNSKNIVAPYAIMSMGLETANSQIKAVAQSKKNILATSGDGNILIDFLENRKISIKRGI